MTVITKSVGRKLRINQSIRVPKVRLIDQNGKQLGVVSIQEALSLARDANLDLVEVAPNAEPPVCKIIDYGKFRYDQTKREKENSKAQHQIKVKEIKLKPNIDEHDLQTKIRQAKLFIEKNNKVKFTCMFRGREIVRKDHGLKLMEKVLEALEEVATTDSPLKWMGRFLTIVVSPIGKKKVKTPKNKEG